MTGKPPILWKENLVREIIRLLAHVTNERESRVAKSRRLLEGLAAMVGADEWDMKLGDSSLSQRAEAGEAERLMNGSWATIQWRCREACWSASRSSGTAFSVEEERLARTILDAFRWLWEEPALAVGERAPDSARLREAVDQLLTGAGRKEIASRMGVTVNTVAGYVKEIYRHYGVNSQPALLKKLGPRSKGGASEANFSAR